MTCKVLAKLLLDLFKRLLVDLAPSIAFSSDFQSFVLFFVVSSLTRPVMAHHHEDQDQRDGKHDHPRHEKAVSKHPVVIHERLLEKDITEL